MKSETVREVCADISEATMQLYTFSASQIYEWRDRILAAYEREMAAKDAEIARLKEKSCEYALPNHGCTAEDKHFHKTVELERKVALLERALKPVIKCKVYECDYGLYTGQGFEQTNVRSMCHNAVREAQRIMKEGEDK